MTTLHGSGTTQATDTERAAVPQNRTVDESGQWVSETRLLLVAGFVAGLAIGLIFFVYVLLRTHGADVL